MLTRRSKLTWGSLLILGVLAGLVFAGNGPQPAVGLYWYDNTDPSLGPGMSAPLNQLLVRTDAPSLYYKSGSANTQWTKIGSGTSSGGTVASVTCSTGLACTPNPIVASGSINVNLTPTTCSAGAAETATAANGTSTCSAFFNTAGTALSSSGGGSTVNLNITPTSCAAGTAVSAIAANGTGTCTSAGFNTNASVYYGDGSDATCAFDGVAGTVCGATLSSGVYTLQRDIAPVTMTVSAGVIVRVNNFRVMVFGTLTGDGGGAAIINDGFPAVGRAHGNCGGVASNYYQACSNGAGSGTNGPGNGNAASANSTAINQWPAEGASAPGANGAGNGQGGGGGTGGTGTGGTGGAIVQVGASAGLFTAVTGWSGHADNYGAVLALYGSGGGGGGCTGGSCTGGGGGGGGGVVFVSSNQCAGTILLSAKGGAGDAGALVGGTSAGGGGGGGGGIVTFIYSHRSAGCTTSVTGGLGGAGAGTGAAGGNGSSGSAVTLNLSGDST